MSERGLGKLPPLAPRSEARGDQQSNGHVPKRTRKKKPQGEADGDGSVDRGERDRSSSRTSQRRPRRSPSPKKSRQSSRSNSPSKNSLGKQKSVGTSREVLVDDAEDPNHPDGRSHSASSKKSRRKKKVASADVGLASTLHDIEDDVVETDHSDDITSVNMYAGGTPTMQSEYGNRVFIEQKGGFKSTNRMKLARHLAEQQLHAMQPDAPPPSMTTIQFGLLTQSVFNTIALYMHGLFAGFGLWHIVSIWVMGTSADYKEFLNVYYLLGMPVQCVYYLLYVICLVAVLDRYDFGRLDREFWVRACTLQNGAVIIIIYLIGLLFSLCIVATDDRISMYHINSNYWQDEANSESELELWRYLGIVRSVAPILGWIIIAIKPGTDRLSKNLMKDDNYNLSGMPETKPATETVRSSGV